MSADIEKLAVYDTRIVQQRPKYAVEKGALSLTNAPFNAISATSSQHTYNIYVPSENVFVDRGLHWTSQVYLSVPVTLVSGAGGAVSDGTRIANFGVDLALTAFPLNSLCSTVTATINDTTTVINSQDVLKEVLRLTDLKDNRRQRQCPTMLDKYAYYSDAANCVGNPIAGYEQGSVATDLVPNGAFPDVIFTEKNGTPLRGSGITGGSTTAQKAIGWITGSTGAASYFTAASAGANYTGATPAWNFAAGDYGIDAYGVPIWATGMTASTSSAVYTLYVRFRSTEKLVLSPFVFSDIHEADVGLFGINNIQLIMNLQTDVGRVVRNNPTADLAGFTTRTVSGVTLNTSGGSGGFSASRVNVIFLTPSLDVPLPPKSVVPYMEFPRYITTLTQATAAGAVAQLQSQTITLPQIPDLFIIYAKPTAYTVNNIVGNALDPSQGDWYFPPASAMDAVNNPLSVNFDNFSGLLSSTSAEQLYEMSVHNGLDMSYAQWLGLAHSGFASATTGNSSYLGMLPPGSALPGTNFSTTVTTQQVGLASGDATTASTTTAGASGRHALTGGFLVLKPGKDITLQTGQAPSLVGNFTFQFNLQVKNNTAVSVPSMSLFVITVNSGFFESIRGSSRIIKGVLSEQDIISAPTAPTGTRAMLARWTGSGMGASLANCLTKTPDAPKVGGAGAGAGTGAGMGKKGLHARMC